MSELSTKYDDKLFRQDLKIYSESLQNKDYKTANIISNRIMTNAWFSDNKFYGVTGFFLRQFAIDVLLASNINESAVSNIINHAKTFTDSTLGQVSSKKFSLKELWTYFAVANEKYRKEFGSEEEKTNYTNENEYTHNVFVTSLGILADSKKILVYPSNNLIKGIINEMNRVSRTYGQKQTDLYILSLLIMIDRIDEYVGMTCLDKNDFEKRMEEEVIPLVDSLLKLQENNFEEDSVNEFLWKLICKWRLYYIKFLEARTIKQSQNKKPVIGEKIKDELVDELVEGIETEVVKK